MSTFPPTHHLTNKPLLLCGECCVTQTLSWVFSASTEGGQVVENKLTPEFSGVPAPLNISEQQLVIQYISSNGSANTALWRHQRFWELYAQCGGRDSRAPGLSWVIISEDPSSSKSAFEAALGIGSKNLLEKYSWVSMADGLNGIIQGIKKAAPLHALLDWDVAQAQNEELRNRKRIYSLLHSANEPSEIRPQINAATASINEFLWESVCPPPNSHQIANEIRKWLSDSVTKDDMLWIQVGKQLLQQTSLSL